MQVFEVKNDIAEILYEPNENNLFLSDFLFLEDNESTIVSQVTNISTTEQANVNVATVQFYLSVDKTNRLTRYNGHTPSKNSEVGYLDAAEIIGLFRPKTKEIVWGDYIRDKSLKIATDMKFISSNCCAICDRAIQSLSVVETLLQSLDKTNSRVLVLDFDGKYKRVETANNSVFGKDFRIPLDSKALDYIFEQDLNDCPLEAKAIIQNIILEIQKYVESTPEGFLPFNHFLNIIAAECKTSNNAGLLTFYNKLIQYKQKKIFADTKSQFAGINESIGSFKLDISDIDSKYHNLILNSVLANIKKRFYVISDVSEENLTSGTLKRIYENQMIRLIPIISHEDKYLNKIRAYCKNLVIFAPAARKKSDEPYAAFVDKLSQNDFILWGESTLFIPLIANTKFADDWSEISDDETDVITEQDLDDLDALNNNEFDASDTVSETGEVFETLETAETLDVAENLETAETAEEIINNAELLDENALADEITADDLDSLDEVSVDVQEADEIEDLANEETERDEALEEGEIPEETAEPVEEIEQAEQEVEGANQAEVEEAHVAAEAVETVSEEPVAERVVQEQMQIPEQPIQPVTPPAVEIKAIQPKMNIPAQTAKKMPNPDELPIYEPKENNTDSSNDLKEGNRVLHAKYGEGTIEQIIVYGKKTLCSIQFDNVGRRLLDPKITTIRKI